MICSSNLNSFPLVQVFELVSSELCLKTVELLTHEQTRTLLKEIADKTGIEWVESAGGLNFIMSGSFKQVEMSRTYFQRGRNIKSSSFRGVWRETFEEVQCSVGKIIK